VGDNAHQPTVLFVDDEERVLKSMRAMFRREFNVLLANSGAEALETLEANDVDVVVSDQRMPEMTGVELLTEVKASKPDCVRVLLTGYADLAAVEASMNEAEVFKYLMKPCPQEDIRAAIRAALDAEPSAVAAQVAAEPVADPTTARHAAPSDAVGIMVMTGDAKLVEGVKSACRNNNTMVASQLEDVLLMAKSRSFGVLVTDRVHDESDVLRLNRELKRLIPHVVIIIASERSDANMLIQLINSGQVFRFLLKPLQVGQCKIWLASALRRFTDRGGVALATFDDVVAEPGVWVRLKNWFLGAQS
jgi:serine/threonine-protein kinase